jgi:predicted amidohydrolase YtcJ
VTASAGIECLKRTRTTSATDASPVERLLILNGRVLGAGPTTTAVAIQGELIVATGPDSEIRDMAGPAAHVLDAGGGLISPGLNDAHQHIWDGARHLANLDLSAETSIDGVLGRIADFARANPRREWINGRGWFYAVFPGGFPDRRLLDRAVPDRPAAFESYDMHTTWVNSAALTRLGVTADTPDPLGGQIVRNARAEATGILKETAMELVDRVLPPVSEEAELDLLRQAMQLAIRHGLTSVQDACLPPMPFEIFERLRQLGHPMPRVRLSRIMRPGQSMTDWERRLAEYEDDAFPRRDDLWLRGGILKTFMDGVIESRTAAMSAPYEGAPAGQIGATGHPRWEEGEFEAALLIADRRGWQVQAHAIGDRAIRRALDAFQAVSRANGPRDRRHRIEHLEAIDAADIPRFGQLGVVASMQPYHADPSKNLFDVWVKQIGGERAARGWSWASVRRAGGRLAFGSDWPVVFLDPRLGLHTAVNRTTLEGEPVGGWIPQERLTMSQALEAYTIGSAYAEFAEREKGSLRPGMLADITVFDRDLVSMPSSDVLSASVRTTIIGGQMAYEAETVAAPRGG